MIQRRELDARLPFAPVSPVRQFSSVRRADATNRRRSLRRQMELSLCFESNLPLLVLAQPLHFAGVLFYKERNISWEHENNLFGVCIFMVQVFV